MQEWDGKAEYLELLKLSLMDLLGRQTMTAKRLVGTAEVAIVPLQDRAQRLEGHDWPANAVTMVGMARLNNLQQCIERVLEDGVPGDLIEAGVWRGGASIFMRAVLRANDVDDRAVWVADSFEGLPPPEVGYPADSTSTLHQFDHLRASLEEVKQNFERYRMLDEQVRFLKGLFADTLPTVQQQFAVVRLDGDMYSSTMVGLESLYPQLSPGGFLIIDDWKLEACRQAVRDFRAREGIDNEIQEIDWTSVYWRKA